MGKQALQQSHRKVEKKFGSGAAGTRTGMPPVPRFCTPSPGRRSHRPSERPAFCIADSRSPHAPPGPAQQEGAVQSGDESAGDVFCPTESVALLAFLQEGPKLLAEDCQGRPIHLQARPQGRLEEEVRVHPRAGERVHGEPVQVHVGAIGAREEIGPLIPGRLVPGALAQCGHARAGAVQPEDRNPRPQGRPGVAEREPEARVVPRLYEERAAHHLRATTRPRERHFEKGRTDKRGNVAMLVNQNSSQCTSPAEPPAHHRRQRSR